eukprot:m.51374 g.51374  ORF g.51374 m.51374 type:complete len:410 (-) comp6304_c0_seq2:92-1321(-)
MVFTDCATTISSGDTSWVMISTVLVLGMIPGLAFFEAGLLRSKTVLSIMMQIFTGFVINSVLWFILGFTLVYGKTLGGVLGGPGTYPLFMKISDPTTCVEGATVNGLTFASYEMMFAVITPLLITGAYAERLSLKHFVLINTFWEILVYYPVAHWIWGDDGWLQRMGALDFAGGIVIHATAGISAILFAIKLGPRTGTPSESSLPLAAIGAALLWMGWFGFNAGSAVSSGALSGAVVANTQIAAAVSGCVWFLLSCRHGEPTLIQVLNGAIAGLAGVTPAAGYIHVQSAAILGLVLGLASYAGPALINHKLGIDDALEVSSVHGIPGIVGALAIGLAATRTVHPGLDNEGLFFSGSMYLFGVQTLALVVAMAYTAIVCLVLCVVVRPRPPTTVGPALDESSPLLSVNAH